MSQFYRDLANKSAAIVRVADKLANDKELYDYTMAQERGAFIWGVGLGAVLGLIVGFVTAMGAK